jgi:small neutral amino acid transporter SnatA (MarC family)
MIDTFLVQFTSLFTMINPIAAIPIYIALTEAMTPKAARWVAMRASLTACIALCLFALLGEAIFSFFNISVCCFSSWALKCCVVALYRNVWMAKPMAISART